MANLQQLYKLSLKCNANLRDSAGTDVRAPVELETFQLSQKLLGDRHAYTWGQYGCALSVTQIIYTNVLQVDFIDLPRRDGQFTQSDGAIISSIGALQHELATLKPTGQSA